MSEMSDTTQAALARRRTGIERTAVERTADDAAHSGAALAGDPGRAQPPRDPEPEVLTRRSRRDRSTGTFDVPARYRKQGWDYQYFPLKVLNEPLDTSGLVDAHEAGWRPVLARDMPDLCMPGTAATDPVVRGSQQLFTRPMHLTQEARQEDYDAAKEQELARLQISRRGGEVGGGGLGDIPGVRVAEQVTGLRVEGEFGSYQHSPTPNRPA